LYGFENWSLALSEECRLSTGFEVRTPVIINSYIFSDIKLCSLLKVNRRFGGEYRPHVQGRRLSQARNQRKAGIRAQDDKISQLQQESSVLHLRHAGFLLGSFLKP
jgi:hypothetical protein